MKARNVKPLLGAMLLPLVALLTGCATPSAPQVVSCPAIPAIPSVSPLPKEGYSLNVQKRLQTWVQELTPTPQTFKP